MLLSYKQSIKKLLLRDTAGTDSSISLWVLGLKSLSKMSPDFSEVLSTPSECSWYTALKLSLFSFMAFWRKVLPGAPVAHLPSGLCLAKGSGNISQGPCPPLTPPSPHISSESETLTLVKGSDTKGLYQIKPRLPLTVPGRKSGSKPPPGAEGTHRVPCISLPSPPWL